LALVSSGGLEIVHVDGDRSALATAAAYLSFLGAGRVPPPGLGAHPEIDRALSRYQTWQGGGTASPDAVLPVPCGDLFVSAAPTGTAARDLTAATRDLERLGFRLTTRVPASIIGSLAWEPPIPVREVARADGSVLGEGKGLTHAQRDASAVGEAVERLLGAGPSASSRLRLDTVSELDGIVPDGASLGLGPRDFAFDGLVTDWVAGYRDDGEPVWLPAELVYTSHVGGSRVCAVGYRNTTGLASGVSVADAVAHGLLEVIERDAYWTAMRTKRGVRLLDPIHVPDISDACLALIDALLEQRIRLHLASLRAAVPVPVVHALLEHVDGTAPCFSHGSGAAPTWAQAAERAITEAVQMRSDQAKVLSAHLAHFVIDSERPREPMLAWSDPLWAPNVRFLKDAPSEASLDDRVRSERQILEALRAAGHRVFWTDLGDLAGWPAVRVLVTRMTQPDPRLERSLPRLEDIARASGLPGLFADAVLS
jgi:ribosomal protein S12 methylthiotransferase accessory factor